MVIEAWIDVGGTFTDCYLVDSGGRRSAKVLSTSLVPISIRSGQSLQSMVVPELLGDCDDFWVGSQLRSVSSDGSVRIVGRVAKFERKTATLEIAEPLAEKLGPDQRFELDCGLEAPVLAVRRLLNCPLRDALPPIQVRLGTTRGTNALLTRRGAPTALAITAPFEDLLAIGDQTRPNLFQLRIPPREVLAQSVLGIEERLDASGEVLLPINIEQTTMQLRLGLERGCSSLAICLMHSYLNPKHEQQLESWALQLGYEHVSRSSQLAPLIEIVARAQTTLVDAYLGPVIRNYLAKLVEQFGGPEKTQLRVMTSAGGLVDWRHYSGKDSILSGPAGGVVALGAISRATSEPRALGLDMGGTSTDVSRVGEDHELEYESTKAGIRILTPTLPIETVAAGGGSVCWFDGVSLRVGPQSAGALPGPACYGRGGPLTITDLNVFLGRLPTNQFPFPLDVAAIDRCLHSLHQQVRAAGLGIASVEQLAQGLRVLANQTMAEAVRSVSIAQGVDPRNHALVGFGGAAGQHICEIADQLGIETIVDSAEAGMLSALGMGLAPIRRDAAVPVYELASKCDWQAITNQAETLERDLSSQVSTESGVESHKLDCSRWLEVRYLGTDVPLTIPWCIPNRISEEFHKEHQRRFGYRREAGEAELVSVRVESSLRSSHELPSAIRQMGRGNHQDSGKTILHDSGGTGHSSLSPQNARFWDRNQWCEVNVIERDRLEPGMLLSGPAIILNRGSTLVLEDGWTSEVLSDGTLRISRASERVGNRLAESTLASNKSYIQEDSRSRYPHDRVEPRLANPASSTEGREPSQSSCDPILRDVFAQRLSAIATQMGLVLQKTAVSVNVKQRRDFSCAVFDARGQLLANAPHVPVHLGAMGETVRAVLLQFPDLRPGDSFVTNDPYQGGSHLPDVTVVTPVFRPDNGLLAMFTANRAHHADIGGITPGSMSIAAKNLGEEGVVIPPMFLTRGGEDELHLLRKLLESAQWPPRNIGENLADIAAQQAANMRGVRLIEELAATAYSWDSLEPYSQAILQIAADRVAQYLELHSQAPLKFTDHLDDGTPIVVSITFSPPGRIVIDFSGTGPVSKTNFNANRSIVTAAVIYVLRCLIADELPLNEGVMRCVELLIPTGILNPTPPGGTYSVADRPAVAAGNVETSQRVVDVLLGAFGAAAASQGTMNNLLFGNERFGFYETICGGAGAVDGANGASGIHTHMTNTRLTDPEILEARYPVRLEHFSLRAGSGGLGRWRGGDGVIRRMRFLEPVQLSLLTSRRGAYPPYGLAGGNSGQIGQNVLVRVGGERETLPNCCQLLLSAGDAIEIQTPGGGGYGHA